MLNRIINKIRAFIEANNFPWKSFKTYWVNSSFSEKFLDVFVPILIAGLMMWFTTSTVTKFTLLIEKFQQISGQVIAAISILAGFNIASITILSSVNTDSIKTLRNTIHPGSNLSLYKLLISFFTWAVIIQLFVVLTSIVLFYMASFIPDFIKEWGVPFWALICAYVWLSITLHSIFLSIRNMKTLYLFVTHEPPPNQNP